MAETIIRRDEAEILKVLGDEVRLMGQLSGTDLFVIDILVPPGSGTPPHRHQSIEIFRVTEGTITFGLFDSESPRFVEAGPGTVVTLPANLSHNYQNTGNTSASMSAVVEGQMIDFFRDISASHQDSGGPPSPAQIANVKQICERHGIVLL